MDPNSSGEGVNSVSSSIKRGLSVDSAQEVKRFRTATGAISAVRSLHAFCVLPFIGSVLPCGSVVTYSTDSECGLSAQHSARKKGGTQKRETNDMLPTQGVSQLPDAVFFVPLNSIRVLMTILT